MLVAANAIVLFVFAGVFLTAGVGRRSEKYWMSWCGGNVALGTALVLFMFGTDLPFLVVLILPNLLLVAGFGLRWHAARQFGGRSSPAPLAFAPALLLLCVAFFPLTFGSYRAVFISANSMLFVLAVLIVYEFWRDRADPLPSRYGLILAYGLVAVSFFVRAIQGIFFGSGMPVLNPDDFRLQIHLAMAIVHSTASGAFALSLAYERNARELRDTALSDELTGLPNRRAFVSRLRDAIAARGGPEFAVTVFDIDHFKEINDYYGHAGGDAVLNHVARILERQMRSEDLVARYGGDEFVAHMRCERDIGLERAQQICQTIEQCGIPWQDKTIHITASIGLYCQSLHKRTEITELLLRADHAMYHAKKKGRNKVVDVTG